jgi:ubiquinone/menaquinone biosynthesis C-methylase UbiE
MKADYLNSIDKGFSSIYEEYEFLSKHNFIDISRRNFIRNEVGLFLKPEHNMLEINSGSGIDAVYFAQKIHSVLATDIASESESFISKKIELLNLKNLKFQKCSFTDLRAIKNQKFDYIFSNYGGLNCTDNLELIFEQFEELLNPNGYITLVIMPPYYPIEMLTFFKGNKNAFRRWKKNGTIASVENQSIETYYYTPNQVKKAFSEKYTHIKTTNIGTFYPSSHYESVTKLKNLISKLIQFDEWINKLPLMIEGIGDYYIITFQKKFHE